ncbi:MAG: hypothetical protein HYU57_06265 [Micavibrio aeruginosavorus]|nr:hypothetical protein [Micavibrio aeruginosavorus]
MLKKSFAIAAAFCASMAAFAQADSISRYTVDVPSVSGEAPVQVTRAVKTDGTVTTTSPGEKETVQTCGDYAKSTMESAGFYAYVIAMIAQGQPASPPAEEQGRAKALSAFARMIETDQSIIDDCQKTAAPIPADIYGKVSSTLRQIDAQMQQIKGAAPRP